MKFKFNLYYCIAFIVLLLIEIAIAVFLKEGFIRHTFGDYLVVILLYCFFKSFISGAQWGIVIFTLIIAYVIEFLQLTNFLQLLGLHHHKLANIVFGNSFSVQDLIAYTLGIFTVLIFENSILKEH